MELVISLKYSPGTGQLPATSILKGSKKPSAAGTGKKVRFMERSFKSSDAGQVVDRKLTRSSGSKKTTGTGMTTPHPPPVSRKTGKSVAERLGERGRGKRSSPIVSEDSETELSEDEYEVEAILDHRKVWNTNTVESMQSLLNGLPLYRLEMACWWST